MPTVTIHQHNNSYQLQQSTAIYQVILFEEEGGYFMFLGTYLTGKQEALEDIKKVIMTFKRK